MSAIPNTSSPGLVTRFAFRRVIIVLALVAALAAASLTVAIVSLTSDDGIATKVASPAQVVPSGHYSARPDEGQGALATQSSGVQRYSARPDEGQGALATQSSGVQRYSARPDEGQGALVARRSPRPAPNDGSSHSGTRP